MAARALDLGPGTKIIVPSVTFLATASAPHLNGADVVFADVDPTTGLMTPETFSQAIARAGKADAVFNVHLNGQCGALEEIAAIAHLHKMKIVDDACHTFGATYVGKDTTSRVGANAHCDLSVFSFHPVKAIAMGEGGAVTTNDPVMAKRLVAARNHGMTRDPADFVNAADAFDTDGRPNSLVLRTRRAGMEFNWRANDISVRARSLSAQETRPLPRAPPHCRREHTTHFFAPYAPVSAASGAAYPRPCFPAWHLVRQRRIDFRTAAGIIRGAHAGCERFRPMTASERRCITSRSTANPPRPSATGRRCLVPIAITAAR